MKIRQPNTRTKKTEFKRAFDNQEVEDDIIQKQDQGNDLAMPWISLNCTEHITYLAALTVRWPNVAWPLVSVFCWAGVGVNYSKNAQKREGTKCCNATLQFSRCKLVNRMNKNLSPFGVNGVLATIMRNVALCVYCIQFELTLASSVLWGMKNTRVNEEKPLEAEKENDNTLALEWSSATEIEFWATLEESKALVSSVIREVKHANITPIKKK